MSEHVATVLGAIGLAETITEFVYALVLRKSFTPFESLFFLTGGSFELVGELAAVVLGIRYVWQANYGREDLVDNMGVVLKDPIHNLAYPHRDAGVIVTALLAASSVGVMVSNVPVLLWATFFPVWGDFSGDVGVRLLLSIVSSLCIASQFLLQVVWRRRGEEIPFWIRTCIVCFKYALGKGVEVYLLIAKSNRLAPDELGKALITFQVIELMSVAVVIARALTSKVYSEATGLEVDQALPKAAVIVLRVSGADLQLQTSQNKGLAASLHNRGVALVSKGKWSKAESLLKRALEIWENAHGRDHLDCALALNSLAILLQIKGKFVEAEPLYRRATEIWETALGPEHPNVATALNNRAALLQEQGKYDEADPLYQRALAIDEKALGPYHPDVASDLNNRAGLLRAQGKYEEAEPLYERSQAIREKALGPEHPAVATVLNNRAGLLSAQGKYAEAQPLFERALATRERALGVDHPDTITSRAWMADLYQKQGFLDKASPLLEEVVSARERVQGRDHPDVASALINRAWLLESQGKHNEAIPLLERASSIRRKRLGEGHHSTVDTQIMLERVRKHVREETN